MKIVFSDFKNRAERAVFIEKTFNRIIQESDSILDVGCSDNDLKKNVGEKVFGIDIGGTPDKKIDLEKDKLSEFDDNSYGLVVCTEVLEHVDNFYEMLDELARVSDRYILISLPNCSTVIQMVKIIATGKTGKFYGLPLEKPLDRHKWFFSWREADKFFNNYCQTHNYKIEDNFLNFSYSGSIIKSMFDIFFRIFRPKDFANDYWILIDTKNNL